MHRGASNWQPLWRFDQWRCRSGLVKPLEMPLNAQTRAAMLPVFSKVARCHLAPIGADHGLNALRRNNIHA